MDLYNALLAERQEQTVEVRGMTRAGLRRVRQVEATVEESRC